LFASVYKSPGRAWSDADITELLSFRSKSVLAGALNSKYPFWSSGVSNPSHEKLLHLFDINQIQILAPQCPTITPLRKIEELDIVDHQNI
jgi:hypothetical protein